MQSTLNKLVVGLFALLPAWQAWSAPVVEVQLRVVAAPSSDETVQLPTSVTSVCVGTQLFLEVWVLSVEPESPGIAGGTVNVTFTAVAEALEIDHGSVFDELPTGTVDAASGTIANLGGNTLIPGSAATPTWALLVRVSFSTIAIGDAVFCVSPGALRFALNGGQPPLDFTTDVLLGSAQIVGVGEANTYGDFDCNNKVDHDDLTVFLGCLAGPNVIPSTCDSDFDGDTDLLEFADFQVAYTGEGP